jgi:Cupin domain
MADYTVVNLKDVDDMAPKFGFAPDLEARFANDALELEQSGVSYQRLAPNFRVPFGHKHQEQEELYVLVEGSARLKLDDEVVELKKWDAVRIPPERMRCVEAGPDGAELLAFGAPSMDDVEMTPGWWAQ